jgi:hypothetical protein
VMEVGGTEGGDSRYSAAMTVTAGWEVGGGGEQLRQWHCDLVSNRQRG